MAPNSKLVFPRHRITRHLNDIFTSMDVLEGSTCGAKFEISISQTSDHAVLEGSLWKVPTCGAKFEIISQTSIPVLSEDFEGF